MSFELFIARRMAFGSRRSFSAFIIRIAIVAVALSVAVMIATSAIVSGFQDEISRKVFGFWGHIHIFPYDLNSSSEDINPISREQDFIPVLNKTEGIKHVQVYANKAGIVKTENDIEGLVLKGISDDFDWSFFQGFLVEGATFSTTDSTKSNAILISQTTARRLRLKVGDNALVYFVQEPPRVRKFEISGIYKTGLEEYDEKYALIDIRHIQRLNQWDETQVGGFEVLINDVTQLDTLSNYINYDLLGSELQAVNMRQMNPNIFEWLDLQNMNEYIILALMIFVAIINMITALLILILERTNMIGILKAIGASNFSIRRLFLYNAALIIGAGLFLGNLIGLGLCLLQQKYGFIQLDEESYYLSTVPVTINWLSILYINVGAMFICLLALIIPSYLVSTINPIKAIRFK